jgi:hypothetical protein
MRAPDLVVPGLDAVVEGAWVALVYVTLQVALAHAPAALGPFAFVAAAAVGVAWSRAARGRLAGIGAGVVIAAAAGLVGWLADPAAREALAAIGGPSGLDGVETALTTNAAGWLLALAFVRGASHGARARDEERTGRVLGRILLLAIPWAVGLAFAGTDRAEFVAQATVCTLLFAGAGLLAVGLGRLETYGATGGVDWRGNRSWVAAVSVVVGLMLAASLPAAFLVGAPPLAVLDAAWVSLATIVGLVGAIVGTVGAPVLAGFEALMAALPTPQPTPLPPASAPPLGGGDVAPVEGDPRVGLTLTILALVALSLLLVAVVSRIRAGRGPTGGGAPEQAPVDERSIDPPRPRVRVPSVRLPRRRRVPTSAADAYLALIDDLEAEPGLRRLPSETPRAHASRLMGGGAAAAAGAAPGRPARPAARDPRTRRDLRLLVADWELVRYAGRRLTAPEDARGVARWRRLRAALRRTDAPGSGPR